MLTINMDQQSKYIENQTNKNASAKLLNDLFELSWGILEYFISKVVKFHNFAIEATHVCLGALLQAAQQVFWNVVERNGGHGTNCQ